MGAIFSHRCHLPDPCPGLPHLSARRQGLGEALEQKEGRKRGGTIPERAGQPVVGSDGCPQNHLGWHLLKRSVAHSAGSFLYILVLPTGCQGPSIHDPLG